MPAAPGLVRCKFALETNTIRFESPINRASQRVVLPGSRWALSASLPRMNRAQMAAWQSFLLQLEGSANTFYGYDPDAKTPRGVATGTALVKGGSQTGSTLLIDGCTPNVNGWLLPGDYFSVNGELKMITAPVNTDGSGEATLAFKPRLRNSPADNAPVTVSGAACTMALVDDGQSAWSSGSRYGIYDELSFMAVEVF